MVVVGCCWLFMAGVVVIVVVGVVVVRFVVGKHLALLILVV